MGSISSQLESLNSTPDLSAIENRLGGIEEQFAAGFNQPEDDGKSHKVISGLAADLKILSQSSNELKGHSLETFDAVRTSLSMILERVNKIEKRISKENSSSQSGAQSVAQSVAQTAAMHVTSQPEMEENDAHKSDMGECCTRICFYFEKP